MQDVNNCIYEIGKSDNFLYDQSYVGVLSNGVEIQKLGIHGFHHVQDGSIQISYQPRKGILCVLVYIDDILIHFRHINNSKQLSDKFSKAQHAPQNTICNERL